MKRPPKPDIRVGDHVEVEVWAWHDDPAGQVWAPTGDTIETVAGELIGWDGWLEGGSWIIALQSGRGHPGRVPAQHVRVLDRATWTEPDLFEAVTA